MVSTSAVAADNHAIARALGAERFGGKGVGGMIVRMPTTEASASSSSYS